MNILFSSVMIRYRYCASICLFNDHKPSEKILFIYWYFPPPQSFDLWRSAVGKTPSIQPTSVSERRKKIKTKPEDHWVSLRVLFSHLGQFPAWSPADTWINLEERCKSTSGQCSPLFLAQLFDFWFHSWLGLLVASHLTQAAVLWRRDRNLWLKRVFSFFLERKYWKCSQGREEDEAKVTGKTPSIHHYAETTLQMFQHSWHNCVCLTPPPPPNSLYIC